ncbi:RluA family pseudouridine synthase [Formosa sp. PL04]|uniref:RluA family pseudouridine synthase n=1 Tax=Formosa sp. PL04 TaxID=3081755 RepID=UPI0029829F31|nr:RluA family pseudouridine synthase [Formosa sp. PL04]MDW5290216.1 RluA family pseudouridine synthase [Formosa sp. PL04]
MTKLELVDENNDYIVVNKTAGLITEKSPFETNTVENQVYNHILKTKKTPYVGVVHRLDRVTSGVLLFAKKKSILVQFNTLFSGRNIQKTYLAIVANKPPKPKGHLVNFLVKNTQDKRADIVASKSKNTLDCSLSYRVIDQNDFGYLLEVKPKTGRFHQIRAQLSHIELPIIGDEKYGSDQKYLPLSVCLHAWKLTYTIPGTQDIQTFEAPLPKNKFWKFKSL